MPNVSLNVPDELHFKIMEEQLLLKKLGFKKNLKDLYYEIIEIGLKSYKDLKSIESENKQEVEEI